MEKIKTWLEVVISGLVSEPEQVKIVATKDEQGILFTITTATIDTGKVIGKKGVIAEAIRTLLRSAGYLQEIRASMKVDAPNSTFKLNED